MSPGGKGSLLANARLLRLASSACIVLGLGSIVGACERARPVEGVVREGETGRPLAGAELFVDDVRRGTTDRDGHFKLALGPSDVLEVRAAAQCPVRVRGDALGRPIHLFPRLRAEQAPIQVGFDRAVTLEIAAPCADGAPVHVEQIHGPPLGARLRVAHDGRRLMLRTHSAEDLVTLDPRPGLVPFSRATRGEYVLRVTSGDASRDLRVTATSVASGTYQVATGARVVLNGGEAGPHHYEVVAKPRGSAMSLEGADQRVASFVPDRFGSYLIRHAPSGVVFDVEAGAFDDVPRDCGRDGCHRAEERGWEPTLHARTFARGMAGELGAFEDRCLACHATGVDEGVPNGGLHELLTEAGVHLPPPGDGALASLPRAVRRHGSVWCSACHGPGRILPPPFRWEYGAKFATATCAQCHDVRGDLASNHTSTHVADFARSPMSRFVRGGSARDPARRQGCASCHSAQGFVAWMDRGERLVPDEATVAPVTCAACHDPHPPSPRPHGVRVFDELEHLGGERARGLGTGAVCASCHRVDPDAPADAAPHAPQADVLLGRPPRGVPASGAPHANLPNACVSCHVGRGPSGGGLGHTFSARDLASGTGASATIARDACTGCHAEEPDAIGSVDLDGDGAALGLRREVADALTRRERELAVAILALGLHDGCAPSREASRVVERDGVLVLATTEGEALGDCDGDGAFDGRERAFTSGRLPPALRRQAANLALVTADGSLGVHNPPLVRALLGH